MSITGPTLAGFITYLRSGAVGFSVDNLPDSDPVILLAYTVALELVNLTIKGVSPTFYNLAVYNLGADNVTNFAADPISPPGDPDYFTILREKWNVQKFIPGVVQSSSDEGTSNSYIVQRAAEMFTMANLQNLKTPWGRRYMGIAQAYGPTVHGIT